MQRLVYTLVLVVALAVFGGCTRTSTLPDLDRAEALMGADSAESALALFDSFDTLRLTSEPLRARFAMLHSNARYKSYIDDTTFTYLQPAIDYYVNGSHGSPRDRALTLFLSGRVNFAREEFGSAIVDLLHAESAIESSASSPADFLLLGFIRQNIAGVYSMAYNWNGENEYAKIAVDAFKLSADSSYIAYAMEEYAHAQQNISNYEHAISLCDSVLLYAQKHNDERLIASAHHTKARSLKSLNRDTAAMYSYAVVLRLDPTRIDDVEKAFVLSNESGQKLEIDSILVANIAIPTTTEHFDTPEYLATKGNYKDAYRLLKIREGDLAQRLKISSSQIVSQSARVFLDNQLQKEKHQKKEKHFALVLSIISLLLIIAVFGIICLIIRDEKEKIRKKLESAMLCLEQLNKDFSQSEIQKTDLMKLCSQYFNDAIADFDAICNTVYEYGVTNKADLRILANAKQKVNKIDIDGLCTRIQNYLNQRHNNIIEKILNTENALSETELKIYCLFAAGLSHSSVAFILRMSPEALYNKKSYIKKKIRRINQDIASEALKFI